MEATDRGAEEYGRDGRSGHPPRPRGPEDQLAAPGRSATTPSRVVRLVSGDLLVTVNPVDGSEIEPCPPAEAPGTPRKLTAAERVEVARAARPPAPSGPDARPAPPLIARQEEREHLVRTLARGRSVRLTGPAGSGRTRLLEIVAEDCADLAPDGVVRLDGCHRGADDLLEELFRATHHAPCHRPDRAELPALVAEIGAIVVLDDAEIGGAALDTLLGAAPECAFLLATAPEVPAPSTSAAVEEVVLGGLERSACVELSEHAVGRSLTAEESSWVGDLWFESEGLPLRFVQASALLRHRDRARAGAEAVDEFGVFAEATPEDAAPCDTGGDEATPLPALQEVAAPAALLASRLSRSARVTLEFAVALGGEVPHQAHLPALVGDTRADSALGELTACGLVTPVGSRYRLAAGVLPRLTADGYGEDATARARDAARHYAWWAGHPSVTPERVGAEADAILAALAVLAPVAAPRDGDEVGPAVRLARTVAPAFAAGSRWGAWERALRSGAEAARLAGEVAEQAYFHHELGVLALCRSSYDRARAELETAIGLRGAAADRRGSVAARRALALVADRTGDTPGVGALGVVGPPVVPEPFATAPARGLEPAALVEPVRSPPEPLRLDAFPATPAETTLVAGGVPDARPRRSGGGIAGLARRNLVAAGAGALLVAVLGTVVTLGATAGGEGVVPADRVGVDPSASQGLGGGDLSAERAVEDDTPKSGGAPGVPAGEPVADDREVVPGVTDAPAGTTSPESSAEVDVPARATASDASDDPEDSATPSVTPSPRVPSPPVEPSDPEGEETEPGPSGTASATSPTEVEDDPAPSETATMDPSTTDSASGTTTPVEASGSAASETGASGTGTPGAAGSPEII
ncbi:ATP-binding protein [Streptomyces sp. HSG2]|uniref:ATP-binding protein n=1 Tax=Streptomyces sp. HSG2 TaxID=2797167 RepID=UPI001908C0C8|nr:ATP-binding protein [Streptomyces sp. HSG2]